MREGYKSADRSIEVDVADEGSYLFELPNDEMPGSIAVEERKEEIIVNFSPQKGNAAPPEIHKILK
jgi:hypothetical protein